MKETKLLNTVLGLIEGRGEGRSGQYDATVKNKNYGRNKEMDNDVYKLRRKVMEVVYDVKKVIPNLPRVTVRIADNPMGDKKDVVGLASTDERVVIWIPEHTFEYDELKFREIVLHELGHAVCKLEHDKSCPIMNTGALGASKEQQDAFIKNVMKPLVDEIYKGKLK